MSKEKEALVTAVGKMSALVKAAKKTKKKVTKKERVEEEEEKE